MRVIADVKRGLGGPKAFTKVLLVWPDSHVVVSIYLAPQVMNAAKWEATICYLSGDGGYGNGYQREMMGLLEEKFLVLEAMQHFFSQEQGLPEALQVSMQDWWVNEYRQLKLFVEPENQNEDGK
jgi:hypothetical protein